MRPTPKNIWLGWTPGVAEYFACYMQRTQPYRAYLIGWSRPITLTRFHRSGYFVVIAKSFSIEIPAGAWTCSHPHLRRYCPCFQIFHERPAPWFPVTARMTKFCETNVRERVNMLADFQSDLKDLFQTGWWNIDHRLLQQPPSFRMLIGLTRSNFKDRHFLDRKYASIVCFARMEYFLVHNAELRDGNPSWAGWISTNHDIRFVTQY